MATIANPPARRSVKTFNVVAARFSVGHALVQIQALDSSGDEVMSMAAEIRPTIAQGIRYRADGGVELFSTTAAAATQPAAAAAAFSGATIAVRLAALETWLQSVGLLPT